MVVLLGLLGALASPVAAQTPPSTDATLSGLELSEGRLDPPFASGITSYATAVGYTVTRITVSPARNDANAAPGAAAPAGAAVASPLKRAISVFSHVVRAAGESSR